MDDYAGILLAHRDGMSIRKIARTLGHSRIQIRQDAEPKPYPMRTRKSQNDLFAVQDPRGTCSEVPTTGQQTSLSWSARGADKESLELCSRQC